MAEHRECGVVREHDRGVITKMMGGGTEVCLKCLLL